MNKKNVLIGVV